MRFVVYGAGAIGGVLGGRLFEAGHDVVLLARGAHYDALEKAGLRLETPEGAVTLPIPVAPAPGEIRFQDDDVILLTMKSQDTGPAVSALAVVAPLDLPVVCVQNGVENERTALRRFENVYGICVMSPTTHLAPGVVQANSAPVTGLLDIGRWPAGTDEVTTSIADALRSATYHSEPRPDIPRWKWGKLILNLFNAIEAVCGPGTRTGEIARRIHAEALTCLEVAGIPYVGQEEDAARRADILQLRPIAGARREGSSSWQSLTRSTGAIETDYLNGEIVLLGRMWGVPTPANAAIQRWANELATQHLPPGSVDEAQVVAELGLD
ncbi:MAG: 2-dehydropantoate 2-reductase [Acidimicrobiales bacterium]